MLSSGYAAYAYPLPVCSPRYGLSPRFARLDVPDWTFRSKPGTTARNDPSGVISRGRSVVRIKTRIGRNPGARLVEKFIIREPVGTSVARGLEFAKTVSEPFSGKAARGRVGAPNRVSPPSNQVHQNHSTPHQKRDSAHQNVTNHHLTTKPEDHSSNPQLDSELPVFSSQVPKGVKRVPVKPSIDPSICVSDVNAIQVGAKSKISLRITESQHTEPESQCGVVIKGHVEERPTSQKPTATRKADSAGIDAEFKRRQVGEKSNQRGAFVSGSDQGISCAESEVIGNRVDSLLPTDSVVSKSITPAANRPHHQENLLPENNVVPTSNLHNFENALKSGTQSSPETSTTLLEAAKTTVLPVVVKSLHDNKDLQEEIGKSLTSINQADVSAQDLNWTTKSLQLLAGQKKCSYEDVEFVNQEVKKEIACRVSSKESLNELTVKSLDELDDFFDEYKIVDSDTVDTALEEDWELIFVMEGTKKKKKVIVKKKGSKVKVRPIEAKAVNPSDTASPGDIMRQLSKKRVSLVDDDLNLVGFNPDKRTSITDDVLVEEAALLDKMIHKEMREARKCSLAFPSISEVDKEVEAIAAQVVKTPSPKRYVPSPQERREMWKKNAMRKSLKSLGGFFKPQKPQPSQSSSEEESECDVNCHPKCMVLMPNLCGVNQKLMVEALSSLKRGRRSASGSHSRVSIFKIDSESEGSQGRVSPPKPPAKTLPRFRTYTINDFQFLKVLGKGSFGKVLLAELKDSQCYYAVKCLKKDVVLEDDDVECTMIERKVLALGTGHPYFCHLFCTFQTESHLFFVMEYLNGGDLMFHIQQSGRFDEGRSRFYAAEIVSALAFLHKLGIVYRDLKLDNVLLDFDGHVRIADFGMCKLQIYLDKTTDTFCGTPDYMAPEIIKGLKYNQCVDWWSFGILLYEMLVGQSPFSGCDEDHLFWSICNERPHMPRHLSRGAVSVLRDLLEKDWTKRLGSSEFGSQDVMNHTFFDGMKWGLLEKRLVDPPYRPTTRHPLDTKYFDRAFTSERPTLTPVDKTILESMDQSQFEGFSYTNPNATE